MFSRGQLQQTRRADPYPWTWEIPAGVFIAVVLVLVLGVHVGRGMALLLSGHGWAWPAHLELFTSLPAVLGGDGQAGLADPAGSPGTTWVRACVILTEVVVVVLFVLGGWYAMNRWGPGRIRGMATRAETQQLLGVRRLRKVKAVVRPDLYGKERR